jgi:hypothetical protein
VYRSDQSSSYRGSSLPAKLFDISQKEPQATNLCSVLTQLKERLEEVQHSRCRIPSASLHLLPPLLAQCEQTLQTVQHKLQRFEAPDLVDKVRFVFTEMSIRKLKLALEGHRLTLIITWVGLVQYVS